MVEKEYKTIQHLEEEVLEEKKVLKNLLAVHKEKISKINEMVELWDSGSSRNIAKAEKMFPEIKDNYNKRLKRLIRKLIHLQDAEWKYVGYNVIVDKEGKKRRENVEHKQNKFRVNEKQLLKVFIHDITQRKEEHAEKILEHLNDKEKWNLVFESLEHILKEIGNLLRYLNDLINSQNFHLKREWVGKLAEEVDKHEPFYRLLVYETEVDEKLKQFIDELEEILLVTIKEEEITHKVKYKEIFHKYDPDLIQFYRDVLKKLFLKEELDDFDTWTWGLGCKSDIRKFSPDEEGRIYEEFDRYHFIVAKVGNKVVGGTCFEFMGTYEEEGVIEDVVKLPGRGKNREVRIVSVKGHYELENSNYCVGWYTAVLPEYQKKGIAKDLLALREKMLKEDSELFGFDKFEGIIIEIDDPSKMTEKTKIKKKRLGMDPEERVEFYKKQGYKKMNFHYIQPPINYGDPPIFYYSFAIKPFKKEWKEQIPSLAVSSFMYHYIQMACDHFKYWKSKYWFEMEDKELRKKKYIELVDLDADFSKYGKY